MILKPLKIGDLEAKFPIVQGGMGIGVSRLELATAVTSAGGIGVMSGAQMGYDEPDFEENPFQANVRAIKRYIKEAKERVGNGIIGINFMVAQKYYDEYVKVAVESGVDLIISGAGLPIKLPELVKGSKVKIAPIVSSLRALKIILKSWDRKYSKTADMIVFEGPKAGGHLGFSVEELENGVEVKKIVEEIVEEVKIYEEKYSKKIPVIVAGGVYDGKDVAKYLEIGASGVQMATRFVGTHECDAHINYKKAYVNATKSDIKIVKSPVGMPGRAMNNNLIKNIGKSKLDLKTHKCNKCIAVCNPKEIPYCISKSLIEAVTGNVEDGLMFCGENAYRLKEIVSVKEVFKQIETELLATETSHFEKCCEAK